MHRRALTVAAALALVSGVVPALPATAAAADTGWTTTAGTGTVTDTGPGAVTVTAAAGTVGVHAAAQPATAGDVYTVSVPVQAGSATLPVQGGLNFLDASGTVLVGRLGAAVTDETDSPVPTPAVTLIAPPHTVEVQPLAVIRSATTGDTTVFTTPVVSARPGPATPVVGPLHVTGNRLYDAHGPIRLRGLHRFGLEGGVNGTDNPPNITDVEWARAQAWGANVVRLSVNEQYWLTDNCHYDPAYAPRVDAAVNGITSRGMVALLDLHYSAQGGTCDPIGPKAMADAANAPEFWREAAARYKDNPLVVFDLYNEPHDISGTTWLSGGTATYGGVTFPAAGMQQLYDAVRSAGAQNVVMATGPGWGNFAPPALLHGFNIVYGAHAYTCPQGTPAQGGTCQPNPYDPSTILHHWLPVIPTAPVVVSEFGWPDPSDGTYMRNVVSYAESNAFSGWIGFAWGGSGGGPLGLSVAGDPTAVAEPTNTGMPLLAGFAANQTAPAAVRGTEHACPASRVPTGVFTDVAATDAHSADVNCMALWNIVQGLPGGVYAPAQPVTREQMASFVARLVRACGGTLPTGTVTFTDIAGDVHAADITALAMAGVVHGTSTTAYDPGAPVRRDQMASFLAAAVRYRTGSALPTGASTFTDTTGDAHATDVAAVAAAGLTGGYGDGTYRPTAPVTREQMASFLARTLDLLVADGYGAVPAP